MSGADNIAVVRRMYESKGDPAVAKDVLAPDIVRDITPGFPGGGVYHGFGRLTRLRQAADSLVLDG